jgi:hypothetical protein
MSRSRPSVTALVAVLLLSVGLAGALTLSPSARTTLRWSIYSGHYKRQVAELPPPADGYLRHIEWDGWGFPGAGNTVVYLVLDPSNRLAAAAAAGKPGALPGLPCEVYKIRELDSSWYTASFYTDTDWEHCAQPSPTASGGRGR